jgi:hypothetical protein
MNLPGGGRSRDFVKFRKKFHASRTLDAPVRVLQFTLPGSRSGTLRLLLLFEIIENQNSYFVIQ